MRYIFPLFLSLFLTSCSVKLPSSVTPIEGFELNRYLGTWYEIARLDHSFERGLEQVSATYSMREDGGVKVLNKGFDVKDKAWEDATGRAYFVGNASTGHLKVSFFGPFFGSYGIFTLDKKSYNYAFVSGDTTDYLWLLSRTPKVDERLKQEFIKQAKSRGFDTNKLIWVKQE